MPRDRADQLPASRDAAERSSAGEIERFLGQARQLGSAGDGAAARLVFALDATMSRQPTWDLASELQSGMFNAAAEAGGLAVQLVYFRGLGECRASRWVADPRALGRLMGGISCRGGRTQIARVLTHARREAANGPIRALVYVGDAAEEPMDDLCGAAGELGLLGVKAFMFHEGRDETAAASFREIAWLTGGAAFPFDRNSPRSLAGLLQAVAAYASGGMPALDEIAAREPEARRLLDVLRP